MLARLLDVTFSYNFPWSWVAEFKANNAQKEREMSLNFKL